MEVQSIEIVALVNITFEFVHFVNTFWGVFATVSIALLGWIFTSTKPWGIIQRLSLSISYLTIAAINCLAQLRFNGLINAALLDINCAAKNVSNIPHLAKQLDSVSTLPTPAVVLIYVFISAAIVTIVLRHNKLSSK
ncbi:hypothetical protein [Shewanella salipaludis]|uniref:Uncharacterized protein n=1 Tax=Shewanella salipaludis TaxID=2723052 RepID=A0A972FQI7_9GAMM|nr:hypothetical protein [Shewanella salipaludis]NMH63911.1 hypothetical protein [Shewanella salipaludis]